MNDNNNNSSNNSITLDSMINQCSGLNRLVLSTVTEKQQEILEQLDLLEQRLARTREQINKSLYSENTRLSECACKIDVLNAQAAEMQHKAALCDKMHDLACTVRMSTCNEGN